MLGLTIPLRGGFRVHLTLSDSSASWCKSSGGHKSMGASGIQDVMSSLRFARSDRFTMSELRGLVASHRSGTSELSDAEVLDEVGRLLASGYLRALECDGKASARGSSGGGAAAKTADDAADKASNSKPNKPVKDTALTWVRIELVDEDGNALAGEDYEISLSDGSSHKGKTNKSPFYADQIPEGVCSIRFPNLHRNYWRPPGR